jgi:PBP1b-binding outer membrane lipoprotein LpoB
MKKIFALLILAGFISSCSQYTCPTYSKKEAPTKSASVKRI